MKAVILAAGKGERLGQLTQLAPKPMIKLNGKPILEYNIDLCRSFNVLDIYINVHHLGDQIMDYFEDGSRFGVKIQYSVESSLLGTAGAVKSIANNIWKNESGNPSQSPASTPSDFIIDPFFVIYGDNFSNYYLQDLVNQNNLTKSIATVGFHHREDVTTSGVAEFDQSDRIISFIEKPCPGQTNSHWVNAGIYFLHSDILQFIDNGYSDFAKDVFPKLLAKNIPMYGVLSKSEVKAFDTPEMLKKNIL
jgi:NDP-sugar pyrophosphorylase family protein